MKTLTRFENLDSHEFEQRLNVNPHAVLLDVRTAEEFRSERIPKAMNIDIMENAFAGKIVELDKTKVYFVYCRSGGRSAHACNFMESEGFKVFNLAGGISNWRGKIE